MVQPQISSLMYDWCELAAAKIGDDDVYYLTKAKWTSVTIVRLGILCSNIGYDRISNEGCLYLRETEWPQLRELWLCKYYLI